MHVGGAALIIHEECMLIYIKFVFDLLGDNVYFCDIVKKVK
jgi:hypothetical protein